MSFYNRDAFCFGPSNSAAYSQCFYDLQSNFGAQMQNNGWSGRMTTDGYINGSWTTPDVTASNIAATNSNLLYISSHGGTGTGQAQICLRQCDGGTWGSDYSVGPPVLPSAWSGPNWLVIDGCDSVRLGVGWENTFGGSLHGILGFRGPVQGLSDGGQQTFTRLIKGYAKAVDAWDAATAQINDSPFATALIPAQNSADAIEASGGPHFGYNGSTSPQYYSKTNGGHLAVQSVAKLSAPPTAVYSLVGESMDESYWNTYYGGSNVPSSVSHPTSNEDVYRNPYVYVDHYLASGALAVTAASTGTARGFSDSDAYQYAVSWLQKNGGLPSDAALTFDGMETVTPTTQTATSDQPYPGVRQYVFIWRHANSGILNGDKIQINVDDAGSLTTYQQDYTVWNTRCQCEIDKVRYYKAPPWVPVYHVHVYVRAWRILGAPISGYQIMSTGGATPFGYCSSDMADPQSIATPCGTATTGAGTSLINLMSGFTYSSSEPM